MSNYVLHRPTSVIVGAYGATSACGTALGSVRKVTFSTSVEMQEATSSQYNDAVVEIAYSGHTATLSVEFEEITAANLALALLGTSSGAVLYSDANDSTPDYKCIYVDEFPIGGTNKQLHIYKATVKPGTELTLANEQQVPTIEFRCMVDTTAAAGARFFSFDTASADTTAPTVSSLTPTNTCTNIATSCAVVWTFSEAIRAEDINHANFFVTASGGTDVAGTLAGSCGNVVVTFTPTAALTATCKHETHASPHIRDVAGNELGSWSSTTFTTT